MEGLRRFESAMHKVVGPNAKELSHTIPTLEPTNGGVTATPSERTL